MSRKCLEKAEPLTPSRLSEDFPEPGFEEQANLPRSTPEEKIYFAVELAKSIQHKINNSLSVVVGQVQFLLLKEADAEVDRLTRLKQIERAALKIAAFSRGLSAISELTEQMPTKEQKTSTD